MKQIHQLFALGFGIILMHSCSQKMTFEEQITNDVITKMGTGICDSIPSGSKIKNVVVGEITPIGDSGLIDVELEFDYDFNEKTQHKSNAVLYSKEGESYYLEALGGCEYDRQR